MPTKAPTWCNRCGSLGQCEHRTRPDPRHTRKWQETSRRVIAAHVEKHGWWCPGHGVPPHESSDLTLDHIVPLRHDGALLDPANLSVLCRSCNSRKGAGR